LTFDFLIQGGIIFDGSSESSKPRQADIGIEGDKIGAVGNYSTTSAKRIIDIKGLCVCPGFIDTHAHSEFTLLADGRAHGKICQGVTTEISGNCGLSAAPLYGQAYEHREKELKELNIKERWSSFSEYFTILNRKGFATNFITLVGHGNLRASQIGYLNREASSDDIKRMLELLRGAINCGVKGLSTGLVYPPGVYATTEEIIELAKESRRMGSGIYTSHIRSEGNKLLEAVREAIRIGLESNTRVHISHLKTGGRKNWEKIRDVFEEIDEAGQRGLNVSCDRYPYIAGSTDLDAVLPSWVYEGGQKEELKRLKSLKFQERIKKEVLCEHPEESYWDNIMISSVNLEKNKWMEGKKLSDISRILKKPSLEFLFKLLIEEDLRVSAIFFSMSEDNLKSILKQPYTMIGSDSSARSFNGITAKGKPHPRGFGTFPRVFDKYVKEEGILSLSEAIYKMTGLPANTFKIAKRGILAPDFFADLIIFDHDKIRDKASFKNPFKRPEGIYYVFVNGIPVLWEGKLTGRLPGRILGNA